MNEKSIDSTNASDAIAATVRAVAGAVPMFGGILQEIVLPLIRDQQMDRIATFARELERRVGDLEDLNELASKRDGVRLIERAMVASAQADDEVIKRIADVVAGATSNTNPLIDQRCLVVKTIGTLTDNQLKWFMYHASLELRMSKGDIISRYPEALDHRAYASARDHMSAQRAYQRSLIAAGLLSEEYKVGNTSLHRGSTSIESSSVEVSELGKLVAKFLTTSGTDGTSVRAHST